MYFDYLRYFLQSMMNKSGIAVVFLMMSFFSCKQMEVYEKNEVIPEASWHRNFPVTGKFIIPDTIATYNIYLIFRHTDGYKYNNIWLNMGLQVPGDSMQYQKLELTLGNDATGWEGTGLNDIWEVRKQINSQPMRFKKSGEYNYSISQIMRDEPLNHVMSAGLRVQKADKPEISN